MNQERYVANLRTEADRFAELVRRAPLDEPVPACPEWDVRGLVVHVGLIHRWVIAAIDTAEQPRGIGKLSPAPDLGADDLAAWYHAAAVDIADVLEVVDPAALTWHPFPVEQVAGFWVRRQSLEVTLHRRDLEGALGAVTPISPDVASDGIDEYFEAALPRLLDRDEAAPPPGSVHVHCTDVEGEWLAWFDEGVLQLRREHAKGDAALRGPAEGLLLRLWSHHDDLTPEIEVIGDEAVAQRWLELPGV